MANFLSDALEREHEELLANHNVVPVYENSLKKETAKPDHSRVKLDQFHSAILEQEKNHTTNEIPAPKLKVPKLKKTGNYGEDFDEYRLHSTVKPVILGENESEKAESKPVQEVVFVKNPDEIKEHVGRILVVDKHEELVEKNAIKPVYVPITTKDFEQGLPKLVPQSSTLIEIKDLSKLELPSVFYSEDKIARVLIKTEDYDFLDRYKNDITGVSFIMAPSLAEISPYLSLVPESQVDYKTEIDPHLSLVPESVYEEPTNTNKSPYGIMSSAVEGSKTKLNTGLEMAYEGYGEGGVNVGIYGNITDVTSFNTGLGESIEGRDINNKITTFEKYPTYGQEDAVPDKVVKESEYKGPINTEKDPYKFTTCFGIFTLDVKPITGLDTGINKAYEQTYSKDLTSGQELRLGEYTNPEAYKVLSCTGNWTYDGCTICGVDNRITGSYGDFYGIQCADTFSYANRLKTDENLKTQRGSKQIATKWSSDDKETLWSIFGEFTLDTCAITGINNKINTAYSDFSCNNPENVNIAYYKLDSGCRSESKYENTLGNRTPYGKFTSYRYAAGNVVVYDKSQPTGGGMYDPGTPYPIYKDSGIDTHLPDAYSTTYGHELEKIEWSARERALNANRIIPTSNHKSGKSKTTCDQYSEIRYTDKYIDKSDRIALPQGIDNKINQAYSNYSSIIEENTNFLAETLPSINTGRIIQAKPSSIVTESTAKHALNVLTTPVDEFYGIDYTKDDKIIGYRAGSLDNRIRTAYFGTYDTPLKIMIPTGENSTQIRLSHSEEFSRADKIPLKKYFKTQASEYDGNITQRGAFHWSEVTDGGFIDNSLVYRSRGIEPLIEDGGMTTERLTSAAGNLVGNILSAGAIGKLGLVGKWIGGQFQNVRSPSLSVYSTLLTPQSNTTHENGSMNINAALNTANDAINLATNTLQPFRQLWNPIASIGTWAAYSKIPWNWAMMPRFSLLAKGGILDFNTIVEKYGLSKILNMIDRLPPKVKNIAIRADLKSPFSGIGEFAFINKYGPINILPINGKIAGTPLFTDWMWNITNRYRNKYVMVFTEGTNTNSDYSAATYNINMLQSDYTNIYSLNSSGRKSSIFQGHFTQIRDSHYTNDTAIANFGTEFYWDMLFSYPKGNEKHLPRFPYKGWMPVQSYSLSGTSTGTMTVPTLAGDITVPDMYKLPTTISITIPETSWMSVDNWLRAYFAAIFCGESKPNQQLNTGMPQLRILPYKQQTLYITIYWMNEQWIVLRKKTFICIPDLKFSYQGQSSKELKTHDIQFNIVGTKGLSQVDFISANGAQSNYITMLE